MIFQNPDIEYVYDQDKSMYESCLTKYPTYFVDRSQTKSSIFGSQSRIFTHDPVLIPIQIKFDNLKKILDRLNLKELPEALAIFSKRYIDKLGLALDRCAVEPDVLIDTGRILYRICDVYPDSFIGTTDHHLHYTCTIERNTRNNYADELKNKPYLINPYQALIQNYDSDDPYVQFIPVINTQVYVPPAQMYENVVIYDSSTGQYKIWNNGQFIIFNLPVNSTDTYRTYNFINQSSISINHQLGKAVHVTIFGTDGKEIEGSVEHTDNNHVKIDFNTPLSGVILIS